MKIQPNQSNTPNVSESSGTVEILHVSELARNRLAQISRTSVAETTESFLFKNELFCGLRYRVGPFVAHWFASEGVIRFFRNSQPIGVIELNPGSSQAA